MQRLKLWFLALPLLVCLFTVAGQTPALGQSKPIQWKLHGGLPGHWLTATYQWWSDQVRQKTNGQLVIEIYLLGSLPYKQPEALSTVAQGFLEVAEVWGGSLGGSEAALEVIDLPGFVPPNLELRKKLAAELRPQWRNLVAQKYGAHVYSTVQLDPRNMYTKREIRDLNSLRGLKIRAIGALESTFTNRLGAAATAMTWTDTYLAMQQGVIDGFWIVDSATHRSKMYEVSRYIIDMQTGGASMYVVINGKAWNSLPGEVRKVLEDLEPAFGHQLQENLQKDMARSRQALLDNGMKVVKWSREDLAKTDQIARTMWQEWYGKADPQGKRVFDQAKRIVQQ
jgi:TRAP-type C4-dicarboxylate transport system substrate-binding protein